ncbi:MAG: DUF6090 family protein [Robiginitalea sp.]
MLARNRISRYVLYALGEIVLVVLGILIALQINEWDEGQKRKQERMDLYMALKSDFATTQILLAEGEKLSRRGIHRMESFLNAVGTNPGNVPVDSLKYWAGGAFDAPFVDPILTTYDAAISSGRISLIEDTELLEELAGFIRSKQFYRDHLDFTGDIFYFGSIYDLRRKAGSLGIIGGKQYDRDYNRNLKYSRLELTGDEFLQLVKEPETYAAIENMLDANYTIRDILYEMDARLTRILGKLESLTSP